MPRCARTYTELGPPARLKQPVNNLLSMLMQELVRLRPRARCLEHRRERRDHVLPLVGGFERECAQQNREQLLSATATTTQLASRLRGPLAIRPLSPLGILVHLAATRLAQAHSPSANRTDTATPAPKATTQRRRGDTAPSPRPLRSPPQRATWAGGNSTVSARTASSLSACLDSVAHLHNQVEAGLLPRRLGEDAERTRRRQSQSVIGAEQGDRAL